MSDVGFLVMDLRDHGRPGFAARVLGAYLESTGDYGGLAVLRFYVVYRAIVRAKIACLRIAQTTDGAERARLVEEYRTYLALAAAETSPASPGRGHYARRDGIGQVDARAGNRRVRRRHPHPIRCRTQTAHGVRRRRADGISRRRGRVHERREPAHLRAACRPGRRDRRGRLSCRRGRGVPRTMATRSAAQSRRRAFTCRLPSSTARPPSTSCRQGSGNGSNTATTRPRRRSTFSSTSWRRPNR